MIYIYIYTYTYIYIVIIIVAIRSWILNWSLGLRVEDRSGVFGPLFARVGEGGSKILMIPQSPCAQKLNNLNPITDVVTTLRPK